MGSRVQEVPMLGGQTGNRAAARPVRLHWLVLFGLVATGYVVGYKIAQHWFSPENQGASFFPPAGVTLAALVLVSRRQWPVVLAAAASAELVLDLERGTSAFATVGLVLANVAEPLVGALMLTSVAAVVDLRRIRDLTAFLICAVIVAPVVGAAIAATTWVLALDGSDWFRFALEWWSGDGLGVLVVGAAIISLRSRPRLSQRRLAEAVLLAALAVIGTTAVFRFGWFEIVYLPIALLVVIAFRIGTTGVAITAALVAFDAAGATSEVRQFWDAVDISPANRVLYLQLALGVIIAATLLLAAEIAERERIAVELTRAESERIAAVERAQLFDAERAARQRAEILEGHASRLAGAVTVAEVAETTITDLRSVGVSSAWVQLVDSHSIELLAHLEVPDENVALYRRYPLETATPPTEAARTGRMVDIRTGADLDARYPAAAVGRARLKFESIASIPLRAAGGHILGVVSFTSTEPHWLDDDRRPLVMGMAEQCGLALERAQLQVEADTAAQDAALLARLGEVLERTTSVDARMRALVAALADERGAFAAVHTPMDTGGVRLAAIARPDSLPRVEETWLDRVAEAALALGGPTSEEGESMRLLAVPLGARGRVLGILTMGTTPGNAARLTTVLLQRVATRAALALDNALLYEQERSVSHALQLGLLGGEPQATADTAIATAYRPGTAMLEVGGDWYDAFTLPDGRLALLVGDVVGHGLEAAVAMGQLRGAVRALALLGSPAGLIERLDEVVETLPQASMATLAYVTLDPVEGDFQYACAGHPPPLLVPAEGEPRLLWEGRSPPLGASFAVERVDAVDRMEPGDTIVLYTDGLIEVRTEGLSARLDLLLACARQKTGVEPTHLVDHILDVCLAGGDQEDDVCVLAVRRVPSERFIHSFVAAPHEVTRMRRALAGWLESVDMEPERRGDAILAVAEAAANAAEHAYAFDGRGIVRVEGRVRDGALEFAVRDEGSWREPSVDGDRGRGRTIMQALMRDVTIRRSPRGTTVHMSMPTGDRT